MAKHFANTIDLLALLSEKIHNRSLLYSLCLTDRIFNAVFSRQLYKCLRWDESNMDFLLDPAKLQLLVLNGNLAHTRVLILLESAILHVRARVGQGLVSGEGNSSRGLLWKRREVTNSQVNQILLDIIRQASALKSFACQRCVIYPEVMEAFSLCCNLQALSINFNADCDSEYKRRSKHDSERMLVHRHAVPKVSAFSRLHRLSLHKMWGDMITWKAELLQTLQNSPHLNHISLSVSSRTESMYYTSRSPVHHSSNPCFSFFADLATQYAELQEQALNLKSLRLSRRISFPNMSAIVKSVNLNALEEVHIDNRNSIFPHDELLDVFGSHFLPQLRTLSFGERGPKSREFLPSLLDYAHTSALEGEFRITSSGDVDLAPHLLPFTLGRIEDSNIVMTEFPLDKSRNSYESIVPQFPVPSFVTSLAIKSPPYVKGSEHLSLDLPRFCESIANLTELKALWIIHPGILRNHVVYPSYIDRDGIIPSYVLDTADEVPEKWRRVWSVQGCTFAAEQISKASRSLRYVRIGKQAWRVWRKDADETIVSLEALDEWEDEVEGPEFFHVPFPLPWNEEMHHVDWRYPGY